MKNLILISTLVFSLLPWGVVGQDSVGFLPSLSWQKQQLEEKVENKVRGVVDSIIKRDQYSVSVDIQVNQPATPQFYESSKNKNGSKKTKADELLAESKKNESLKTDGAEEKESSASVKFEDVEPTDVKEDIVTFSKFGVQAPLIDDYNDFQPNGKIVLTMDAGNGTDNLEKEFAKKEQEYKEKIEELKGSDVSPIEQIWKYNNSIDIFNNLKSVVVTVRLSESLDPSVREAVVKYVKDLKFNFPKIKPEIKFENVILGAEVAKSDFASMAFKIFDLLGEFSTLFGLVLAVLLLGIVGKKLIEKFHELNSGGPGAVIKNEGGQKEEDKGAPAAAAMAGAGGEDSGYDEQHGIERFISLAEHSINSASLLVKEWLNSNNDDHKIALRAIVQQMKNNDLMNLFRTLTERQRAAWRNIITDPLSASEMKMANKVISKEIVKSIIVPSSINDPEVFDLILKISEEKMQDIIVNDESISSVLVNVLSTEYISKILNRCAAEDRDRILSSAFSVNEDEIIAKQDSIKEILEKYVEDKEIVPFSKKAIEIIPNVLDDLEQSLYERLSAQVSEEKIVELALSNFPSFLIEKIEDIHMKKILTDFPLDQKVKLFVSIEEEMKNKFMDIYAPSGSKAYDLLQVEFQMLESNPKDLEKIQGDRDKLWSDFVHFVRNAISNDKEAEDACYEIIKAWASLLYSKKTGSENLKEVA